MLRRLPLILLFDILFIPARANLNETIEQLIVRYGKPDGYAEANAKTPFGNILFKAGAYELVVFILNNKEVGARVSKVDKSPFSSDEIQAIMAAETSSAKWVPTPSTDPSMIQWSRSDHATASYDKDKHMLLFTSDTMAQVIQAPPKSQPAGP